MPLLCEICAEMSQQFSQKSGLHTVLLFTQHCVDLGV